MAFQQQKIREIMFQMLFSLDISKGDGEDIQSLLIKELAVSKKTVRLVYEKVLKLLSKQSEIDQLIAKSSSSYAFNRIQSIERNALRIGVYELFFDDSIPPKVAISEAMRLCRKFGTPQSASFVNAILDNLYKSSLGEKVDPVRLSQTILELEHSENVAKEAAESIKIDAKDDKGSDELSKFSNE